MNAQVLSREQGVVAIFSNAIRLYQRNYLVLLPLSLIGVPIAVASGLIQENMWPLVGPILLALPTSIFYALLTGGMIHVIDRARSGQVATLSTAIRAVAPKSARLITTQFLGLFMTIVTILAFPYFLVRWHFTSQAVMLDNVKNWGALDASSAVVSGRWWRAAAVLLIIFACQLVLEASTILLARTGAPPDAMVWRFLVATARAVWVPLAVCAETVLYFDLKARAATAALWNSTS